MKKLGIIAAWLAVFVVLFAARPVHAAGNATLNIDKRVTATTKGDTQATRPLAGATYRVTRLNGQGQPATGVATYTTTLTTDANGRASVSGLAIGANYQIAELKSAVVPHPAAAVTMHFTVDTPVVTYTPKSGLTTTEQVPTKTSDKPKAKIVQTSGSLTWPLGWLVLALGGALAAAGALARRRRQEG